MAEYVKNIIINCNEGGSFASATMQRAGVKMKAKDANGKTVEIEEAQPNESVDLKGLKALIKGL